MELDMAFDSEAVEAAPDPLVKVRPRDFLGGWLTNRTVKQAILKYLKGQPMKRFFGESLK